VTVTASCPVCGLPCRQSAGLGKAREEAMSTRPVRLQLSRKKGARLVSPNGLPIVIVDRRSKWGNPFLITGEISRALAVHLFARQLRECGAYFTPLPITIRDIRRELRGKNLACWCPLDESPCHAEVLLQIANEDQP